MCFQSGGRPVGWTCHLSGPRASGEQIAHVLIRRVLMSKVNGLYFRVWKVTESLCFVQSFLKDNTNSTVHIAI